MATNDPEMMLKAREMYLEHHIWIVLRQYIKVNDAHENKSVDGKSQC